MYLRYVVCEVLLLSAISTSDSVQSFNCIKYFKYYNVLQVLFWVLCPSLIQYKIPTFSGTLSTKMYVKYFYLKYLLTLCNLRFSCHLHFKIKYFIDTITFQIGTFCQKKTWTPIKSNAKIDCLIAREANSAIGIVNGKGTMGKFGNISKEIIPETLACNSQLCPR